MDMFKNNVEATDIDVGGRVTLLLETTSSTVYIGKVL